MADYGNLWEEIVGKDDIKTTEGAVEFVKEQCRYLNRSTGGKVRGRFIRTAKHVLAPSLADIIGGSEMPSRLGEPISETPEDDLADANDLYELKRYSFDILSNTYRFRVFDVILGPVYPVAMELDEGIYEEQKADLYLRFSCDDKRCSLTIEDEGGFAEAFSISIRSKKVRFILRQLREEG